MGIFNDFFKPLDLKPSTIAMAYHYKSLHNYKNVIVHDDLKSQVQFERDQLLKSQNNIKDLIENNSELSKVLNNGKSGDDIYATKTIKSNNELVATLATLKGSSYASEMLLRQSEKTANQNSNTLLFLFITIELFASFGLLGKHLQNSETDKSTKDLVTTMHKLNALEENVTLAVETALIDKTYANVNEKVKAITNHPTPSYNTFYNGLNQTEKAQIGFNANMVYKPHSFTTESYNSNYSDNLLTNKGEKPTTTNNACVPCIEKTEEEKVTENNKIRTLDMMKFSYPDNTIISILWDNGTIGFKDKLVKKSLVLAELEDRGIKEDDYTSLLRRLKKQKLVYFDIGYYSNCNIKNVVSTETK